MHVLTIDLTDQPKVVDLVDGASDVEGGRIQHIEAVGEGWLLCEVPQMMAAADCAATNIGAMDSYAFYFGGGYACCGEPVGRSGSKL